MYFVHPVFAVLLSILALFCVRATFIWVKGSGAPGRFGTIDGLRGYLAFFVFLHHAAIWFTYSRTGVWTAPESNLYTQLGQASVGLFFMITSFLFYDKLLNSQSKAFDWPAFLIGRFFRLTPLYLVVMAAMLLVVAMMSGWTLMDKPRYVFFCAMRWILFAIPGMPDINSVETVPIVAGVTWSLPYEWCFYLVLPLIALTTGQRPSWRVLAVAAMGIGMFWLMQMLANLALLFVGGLIAARLVRYASFTAFARTAPASAIVVACLAALLFFPTAYDLAPGLILAVAFCLIAGGADLFGLLVAPTSRRLGELAYSIYLLHGILLFCMIQFVVGKSGIATMSATSYWTCIAFLVPIVLSLSAVTYHYIEKRGIAMGKEWNARLRNGRKAGSPEESRLVPYEL